MARPDFSDYVVHFTKDKQPHGLSYPDHANDGELCSIAKMSAKDRLLDILMMQNINARPMPWFKINAVCFTECTWASLIFHAQRYSYYGIGFSKEFIFKKCGGPVIYIRPDLFEEQKNYVSSVTHDYAYCKRFAGFLVPFVPAYAEQAYRDVYWNGNFTDYSHEREWRLTEKLDFSYEDVEFVIIGTHADLDHFSPAIASGMNVDKFLIMKNYEQVEKFWPTH